MEQCKRAYILHNESDFEKCCNLSTYYLSSRSARGPVALEPEARDVRGNDRPQGGVLGHGTLQGKAELPRSHTTQAAPYDSLSVGPK